MKAPNRQTVSRLDELPNIGKVISNDLLLIGVSSPQELIGKSAYQLYKLLCIEKGKRVDHCVIDVFLSVIHYMEGGESRPWWTFTEERKRVLNEFEVWTDKNA